MHSQIVTHSEFSFLAKKKIATLLKEILDVYWRRWEKRTWQLTGQFYFKGVYKPRAGRME